MAGLARTIELQRADLQAVMAYLSANFRESKVIWPYTILSRDGTGPPRPGPAA